MVKIKRLLLNISLLFITLGLFAASASAAQIIIDKKISGANEDAYEINNVMRLSEEYVDVGAGSIGGFRYSLPIPQGADIKEAKLYLGYNWASGPSQINIFAQDSDESQTFSSSLGNLGSRPRTSENKVMILNNLSWGGYQESPDISSIIEEVTNRSGWSKDNHLTILTYSAPSTNYWEAISYEETPWIPGILSARLYIVAEVPEVTQCSDNIDNDGDSKTDLEDPDCSGPEDDSEFSEGNYEEKNFHVKIIKGEDDAFEVADKMHDTDLYVDSVDLGGFRFTIPALPSETIITGATLSLAHNWAPGQAMIKINGEKSKNPAPFTAADKDLSNRPKTQADVDWNVGILSWGQYQESPDISEVIQEIIDQQDHDGNIVLFTHTQSGNNWEAVSYEGSEWDPGVLSAELKVTALVKNMPEPEKEKLILVLDDPQYDWLEDISVELTEISLDENADIYLNVIPWGINSSTTLGPKLTDWYNNFQGKVEIGQHGFRHSGTEYNMNTLTLEEQKTIIQNGKDHLGSIGIIPKAFTPPGGAQSPTTLQALAELGYNTDFDWWVGLQSTPEVLVIKQGEAHLCEGDGSAEGASCVFKSSSKLMDEFDNTIAQYGYAAMAFHVQDFITATGEKNTTRMDMYRQLLQDFKASGKYEFVTASEYHDSVRP